jgi:hypothetical protein
MTIKHDYPACAIFRGGKCTCDEADKLCPKCGSEEWQRLSGGESHPDSAECAHCHHEWTPPAEVWR